MIWTHFLWVAMGAVTVSAFLCMYRIVRGPTAPDRTVAIDILGVLLLGACGLLALLTGRDFPMTVAIVWSLLAFIGTVALAKHLEGRPFDD
jgi:multicomponent Na+:H+ antiporter subunit F